MTEELDSVRVGSLDWLERWQQVDSDSVALLADLMRERWLELGGDDRSWGEWLVTVHREYGQDELADMRSKVTKALGRH